MRPDIFYILAISLLLTLILEVLFAFLIGKIRTSRGLLLTVLTNTLTNPPVVLIYTLFPSLPLKIALEIAVVLVEWLVYKTCSDEIRRPLLYALSINAFSYLTGEIINHILPLLF